MPSFFTAETDFLEGLPVTTDGPVSGSFEVPQFDPALGDLVSATITFPGIIFSTAFVQDIFPTGFDTFAFASITVLVEFEGGAGAPDFETAMALLANGSGYLPAYGSTVIPLNTASASDPADLTNLGAATGTGTFEVDFTIEGIVQGFPLPALVQQDLSIAASVTYGYVGFDVARLFGSAAGERLDGGAGKDRIEAGGGADTLYGRGGSDDLLGEGGNDKLFGGKGRDFLEGGAGRDKLVGGAGADDLSGDSGADRLVAGGGNDTVYGGDGDDSLGGGAGADALSGGRGADSVTGGGGDDRVYGGRGNDRDVLTGGRGADTFVFDSQSFADVITDFGAGADLIDLSAFLIAFADITITDIGADTRITIAGFEDIVIRLDGFGAAGQLSAEDFVL